MTLTPCPPLSSPPSSPGCHLSANLSRCIANPTRSFIILFFTLLFFFPPPPLFPLSGGGLGVAGLYFPTGFARAGPVAGFQGDTLLLAFSDLRQVGLCLPRGPLSFIFSFCVFFFFIFFIYPTIFFFCLLLLPPTSLSFSSFSHPPSHSPQPSSSSPFIWFSDFIPSSFSLLFFCYPTSQSSLLSPPFCLLTVFIWKFLTSNISLLLPYLSSNSSHIHCEEVTMFREKKRET